MIETKLNKRSAVGNQAVRLLRQRRLNQGLPFMINVKLSEEVVSYLEFPDGTIKLVERSSSGTEFNPIKTLSKEEATDLRGRYRLV